jgi:hypothetical protein
MTGYRPPAYRFLLTDRDPETLRHAVPYDPKTADGPLKQRRGEWYWNGEFCAEFMIEADLSLDLCWRLNFVSHNTNICRLLKSACRERDQLAQESAALIVGYLIGVRNKTMNQALMPDVGLPGGRPSTMAIDLAGSGLWLKLAGRKSKFGGYVESPSDARRIVRAALLQQAIGNLEDARGLVRLLASTDIFDRALHDLIKEHFGLKKFEIH